MSNHIVSVAQNSFGLINTKTIRPPDNEYCEIPIELYET